MGGTAEATGRATGRAARERSAWPAVVDLVGLRRLLAAGAQLVEVLPADEYRELHLPGAISIPLRQLDADTTQRLDRGRDVVVYCWDGL